MLIKPATGLKIRNPQSMLPIPETGLEVPDTDTYWQRRLADGDVVIVAPVVSPLPTKSSTPTKASKDKE